MADDEGPPEITPWGERDEPDKLFGGFWWVSAERHGGLYLTAEQRKAIPESLRGHSRDGDGIWWEENSAWSLPVMCLLAGRPESSLTEEEQEKLYFADQTCRDEYPREWEQLTGRRLMPGESQTLDGEIAERHGFDGSGPLPGGTRFHTLVLAADEDEQARNAGRVHMQVVHAGDEGNEFTKTYAVPAPITREFALVENKPENLATWLAGKGCKLDCEDGPAVVERRPDGEIRETWYRDGHWHRTDGPALVERTADGSTLFEDYFLEGGRVAKEAVVFPERGTFDALLAAAEQGETAEVKRLVQSGANIHGCDDAPLRAAAQHGNGETVRALVVAGAKVGAWDEMALRCMVHRGDTETVKFLLDKGADIFAIEDKVVKDIERQGRSELAGVLRDAEAARMGAGQHNKDRGEMMGAVRDGSMTDEDAAHMTVTYKTPEGDAVTRIYAIGEELVRENQKLPFHDFLTGRELNKFLQDRDCKLDCSTGPAVVEHRADGSSHEEYRRDGELHRADGPARIERGSDGSVILDYFLHGEAVVKETLQNPRQPWPGNRRAVSFTDTGVEAKDIFEKRAEAESLKSHSPGNEPQRDTGAVKELTIKNLTEDPWLVLDHPIPEDADPRLLKAARAAAVVCRYEAEDLIAAEPEGPHAQTLDRIDAIFTDIRHRLGEPEPAALPLDPEMEKTLNELEKTWQAQPQKQHDRER